MSKYNEFQLPQEGALEDSAAFDLAPVSLWLEDFSRLKRLLVQWKSDGMDNVAEYLREDGSRLDACLNATDIIRVNPQTLLLYEVDSLQELIIHLPQILGTETSEANIDLIAAFFDGKRGFSGNVINHTSTGRRLNVRLRGNVVPGHEEDWDRILIAVEDVTDLQESRVAAQKHQIYSQMLFEYSPVSLWVLDCSNLKKLVEQECAQCYGNRHPTYLLDKNASLQHLDEIRVIDVNRQTLNLYRVDDKTNFIREGYRATLITAAADLLSKLLFLLTGHPFQERDAFHKRCDNSEMYVHQQMVILPGYEGDQLRVQIAETDITSRKRAEAHIKYLRDHDGLTHLYSRDFFYDEIARLTDTGVYPVSVVVADLNGLKQANDLFGHSKGDELLRRFGDVLTQATPETYVAARTGGDEFSILLPSVDAKACANFVKSVARKVSSTCEENLEVKLSVSIGAATRLPSETLTTTIARADAEMYKDKLRYYEKAEQKSSGIPARSMNSVKSRLPGALSSE